MLFSIIIPVYNTEQYLSQCVDSVLAQQFCDYEILLVDDGSKDKSPLLCDDYAFRDKRIKSIHKSNGGLSSARNTGLDKAEGDYIVFLDSDDWWDDETMLTNIAKSIDELAPDVLCFRMKKYLQNVNSMFSPSEQVDMDDSQKADVQSMIKRGLFGASACNKIIKRIFLEKNNIRFVQGQLSEDIEWCLLLLHYGRSFLYVDKPYYVYRKQNGESISSNVGRKNLEDIASNKKIYIISCKRCHKVSGSLEFSCRTVCAMDG